MHERSQGQLLQLIHARATARRFPRRLNRWQQQCHQHTDDGDHDQQFDERKTALQPSGSI